MGPSITYLTPVDEHTFHETHEGLFCQRVWYLAPLSLFMCGRGPSNGSGPLGVWGPQASAHALILHSFQESNFYQSPGKQSFVYKIPSWQTNFD